MDYTSIKVGQLPTDAIADANFIPHEVGGLLKKATIADLAAFIGSSSAVGFRAVSVPNGGTLPTTTQQEFILVGPGTYNNVGGGSPITVTEELNAIVSNGTFWFIGVQIPIEAAAGGTAIWGGIGGTLSNQTDLQTALNAKEPSIASGTTAQYFRGDKTWQTLDKTAVGLANVDNTSDANKPISTATQTALNLKANLASPTFTGTVSGITKAMVGLSNVDNTSDLDKPVSTAQATAINSKVADAINDGVTLIAPSQNAVFDALALKANDNAVVKLTGTQSIQGAKTFENGIRFDSDLHIKQDNSALVPAGYTTFSAFTNGFYVHNGINRNANFSLANTSTLRQYEFPDKDGTFAMTSDIPTNPITGTGTTNFLSKFTASGTIGNSQIFDNGTNVGIGIEAQTDAKLYVQGALNIPAARFLRQASFGTVLEIGRQGFSFGASFGYPDDNTLSINTNNAERMRITSGGNVGIGTTSPRSASGFTTLALNNVTNGGLLDFMNNGTLVAQMYNTSSIFSIGSVTSVPFSFTTADTERMRITSGGNVGIGTTSPVTKLHINGGLTGNGLFIQVNSASNTYLGSVASWQGEGTDTNTALVAYNGLVLATSDNERMRITPSGNVGIGTTSPAQKLDVNGLINSTNGISVGGSGVSVVWTGTQAAYDAIGTKSSTTIYFIQ